MELDVEFISHKKKRGTFKNMPSSKLNQIKVTEKKITKREYYTDADVQKTKREKPYDNRPFRSPNPLYRKKQE